MTTIRIAGLLLSVHQIRRRRSVELIGETGPERRSASMVDVRIGRVYDPREGDAYRVLVDRLWPRGVSKARADLDEWAKEVAPSAELREWFGHDPDRFSEFASRYKNELREDPQRAENVQRLRSLASSRAVLLLTATKEPANSQAAVLAELLREA
jgi:uncharacterized protein YeaO (DUF488 family)